MYICVCFCVNTIALVKKITKFSFRMLSSQFSLSSMTESPANVAILCFPLK